MRKGYVSFSLPVEIANEIESYCNKTGISKSKFAVRLLEVGLKAIDLSQYATVPHSMRGTV